MNAQMVRWVIWIFLLGLPIGGCDNRSTEAKAAEAAPAEANASVAVTEALVSVRPSSRLVNFVGTLFGNEEVTISSQVEGQIEALSADLGDQVEAGQALARIDDAQWRARLREAEARLAKAQADAARSRQLIGTSIISKQEYESVTTNADVARAQRDTLLISIEHSQVAAPIRAAIAKRFVSVGEYVRPGTPLFTLVAQDPLKLRGEIPERFAHEVRPGQAVQVKVDAYPDVVFPGQVTRISPASNPQNRSVALEAQIGNADLRLKPGFFANAAVVTRSDDHALMVPQEAVISFAGVTKVFVIDNGVAREREVTTGGRGTSGMIEITDGLSPQERVAVSGLTKLGDGVAVTVKSEADAKAEAPTPGN